MVLVAAQHCAVEYVSVLLTCCTQSRPSLLRAAVRGPTGTPYAHALFFFDIALPEQYPNAAPDVKYLSQSSEKCARLLCLCSASGLIFVRDDLQVESEPVPNGPCVPVTAGDMERQRH